MQFQVTWTPSAQADFAYYRVSERRVIMAAIRVYLTVDANIESRRRKRLTQNPLAPWELRAGKYHVFYELEEAAIVKIIAVGYKEHNDLFIQGRKVHL